LLILLFFIFVFEVVTKIVVYKETIIFFLFLS